MERLTACDSDDFAYVKGGKVMDKKVSAAILRLAAYEDTGLSPDEIQRLKAQLESALEDLYYIHYAGQKGCEICRNSDQCGESDSHIGECAGFEWRGPQPPKEEK